METTQLKEGQIYLLDGSQLVEATFNDNTGFWQLHEPEDRSSWLVSPNGKLLGMQFDVARDVWLLEPEPDVWTTGNLAESDKNAPRLPKLLRQVEQVAEEKHGGQLTLLRVSTGWKATFGSPNPDSTEGQHELQKLKTYKTLYEAIQSLM
ncbi:MAG TPA: hypothetical protein P5526_12030 [Anaerolineae bacterium]|nr:hypothetical protein [Anaerolineae bacterium]HRV92883.1 hypothetical protein [Anaerolineae bacterium]